MLRHVELALLGTGAVESCAVLSPEVDGRRLRIAYVVPHPHVPFSGREIADRLRRTLKVEIPIEPERGKHVLLDARGLIAARKVLILGTAPVWDFDYAEVKRWSQGVLQARDTAAHRRR